MMLGEPHRGNPTLHVPPWPQLIDDPPTDIFSPLSPFSISVPSESNAADYSPYYMHEAISALHRYLPSNDVAEEDSDSEALPNQEPDSAVDAYSSDHFRMFDFKVRRCARGRSHDWTECPYAHPGEKARRRDPRKYHYSGTACPDFRKGSCKKGDACEYAHGVFECWLHPERYRTQPCKDGTSCRRRVCFFAHTPEQLRVLPLHSPRSVDSYDGSPLRHALESSCTRTLPFMSSPGSASPTEESPPMSPVNRSFGRSLGSGPVNMSDLVVSMRNLQLGKVNSLPSSWNVQVGSASPRFGSPRGPVIRPGFCSLPCTPTEPPGRGGVNYFDLWNQGGCEEEPLMERVESGRDIRTKMFEKLSKENSLGSGTVGGAPDFEWVSELVK